VNRSALPAGSPHGPRSLIRAGNTVDALTAFLADRMLKVGGYLDFDDYDWTFCASPSCNPTVFPLTRKLYTAEQIASKQVKMIVDLLIRRDPRYQEVVANKIFQKFA
jgi:hypothetical protein